MTGMVNPSVAERIQHVGKQPRKREYFRPVRSGSDPLPAFVLGYGRSGTTRLIDPFEHDGRIEVFQKSVP